MSGATRSENKHTANRANAQQSTGPRTPEGKARASQNATKHGLYAQPKPLSQPPSGHGSEEKGATSDFIAGLLAEEGHAFEARLQELREEYAPADRHEARLVERLALCWWRLERVGKLARARLALRLAQEDCDPVDAVLEAERICPAEAQLERAIARLHKHLLFLQRYRAREQQRSARADARREMDEVMAQIDAEAEFLMQRARQRRYVAEPDRSEPRKPEQDVGDTDLDTDTPQAAEDSPNERVGYGSAIERRVESPHGENAARSAA